MTKQELRKKYKKLRQELSPSQIDDYSLNIANKLLELDIWQYSFYHVFLPIEEQNEVNTEYILNILAGKDKNIVISKSDFATSEMTPILLTDGTTIKKNKHNIPEPVDGIEINTSQLNVVFVPLLAYDKKGNRVGYGKGFYDKFLAQCSLKALKIGLSFFESEDEITDVSDLDIKLDYCVAPQNVFTF